MYTLFSPNASFGVAPDVSKWAVQNIWQTASGQSEAFTSHCVSRQQIILEQDGEYPLTYVGAAGELPQRAVARKPR